MKLTPKQRAFLQIASQDGARIGKCAPEDKPYFWYARTPETSCELRERWGDALNIAGYVAFADDQTEDPAIWTINYCITDAGRKAIE